MLFSWNARSARLVMWPVLVMLYVVKSRLLALNAGCESEKEDRRNEGGGLGKREERIVVVAMNSKSENLLVVNFAYLIFGGLL